MPTYDYKCTECDKRFEVSQSIHEDSLTTIDGCPVKKVFGAVSISFKGSGFYRNDSRGTSSSTDSSTSTKKTSSTTSADSSSTSTSDTKKSEPKKSKGPTSDSAA